MSSFSKQKQLLGLAGWLVVSFAAATVGAAATLQAKTFYAQLLQPGWAPPAWLFGPVWTVLYTLMAIAAWLVWRSGGFRPNKPALILFLLQLVFNALWSWLFFGWHLGGFALIDILLLLNLILLTLVYFWRVRPLAGVLFIPYLLWVGFATLLNYAIWQLNPMILG